MKQDITEIVDVPQGVTVEVSGTSVKIKGPKGECSRTFVVPHVDISKKAEGIVLSAKNATKREKSKINSVRSHLKNMIAGVQSPYVYVLKVCSGHFPMNITLAGNKFSVKNFLGEKVPRVSEIPQGANVKVEGDKITVTSVDLEVAGKTASNLEQLTRIARRDRRIFQDGIHLVQKPGVEGGA